ncbi:MAG: hypothetical protein WDL87_01960 [Candidatus Omnitrophota bacterium]|jgi:hypothetical protein
MDNLNKKKQNIVELMKKRRHIHLVEKGAMGKSSTPSLTKSELKELESMESPASPILIESQEQIAKLLGRTVRTVQRLIKEGMPVTPHGKYDPIEIRSWLLLREKKKTEKGRGKEFWEAKYREYKAKLAEITLKQQRGELVYRSSVERNLVITSLALKNGFLGLANSLPPVLHGKEPAAIRVILKDRIGEVCNMFNTGEIFEKVMRENRAKFYKNSRLITGLKDEESETD